VRLAAVLFLALLLLGVAAHRATLGMPGRSYRGALPALTAAQRATAERLRADVLALAKEPRSLPETLTPAAAFLERELLAAGLQPGRQPTPEGDNLEVEIGGRSREVVVIGAHYDSVDEAAGADDNASGSAALLELARRFAQAKPDRTLRFVFFAAEEPPNFKTERMGSWLYARRCHERGETIVAMLSLESIGYYDTRPHSQHYPAALAPFFPSTGDFIAFAGNTRSRALIRTCIGAFRRTTRFPSEGAAVPEVVQEIGWSDQWSFWQFGWPALMVTDTALFRNPHYHRASDRVETLDYERLARVVDGLEQVVRTVAS
jgi:Zn-dependent M28 family amino/carboxypeptidase